MKNFHISGGNSTHGLVGLCALISARNKKDAIVKLRRALEKRAGLAGEIPIRTRHAGIQYINVYICPTNINLSQVSEEGYR
jgi:hypothetical protein